MPVWSPPVYNLVMNCWQCDGTVLPSNGSPDRTNIPCQKYICSRMVLDVTPPTQSDWWQEWNPPVQIRTPRLTPFAGEWITWTVCVVECPAGSGQYYRVFWRDIQHEGFPNQYALLVVAQCNPDGTACPPPHYTPDVGVGSNACGD